MSTHNIGFYEDLTKIIFKLSSNIIKYAPYFLCCTGSGDKQLFWLYVSLPDSQLFSLLITCLDYSILYY